MIFFYNQDCLAVSNSKPSCSNFCVKVYNAQQKYRVMMAKLEILYNCTLCLVNKSQSPPLPYHHIFYTRSNNADMHNCSITQ